MDSNELSEVTKTCMPAAGATQYLKHDPRTVMITLLNEGKSLEVIRLFDPTGSGIPDDPRLLNGLVWAYLQEEDEERAATLADAAIQHFNASGEDVHEATALVNRASIAWRQEGRGAAEAWIKRALNKAPSCELAWLNWLNYASKERDADAVRTILEKFFGAVPKWASSAICRHWMQNGIDLVFARTLPCFAPVLRELAESQGENQ